MSDVRLFHIGGGAAAELASRGMAVEKSLQTLFEANLEALLGIRFLASEYSTGPIHGGRIDTLGLDENGRPVIIEYKRGLNENVINQGLFYLEWLLDHRREFQWLVMDVLGRDAADTVEWAAPRLLCIAGDFTKFDGHAVKHMARDIELLRYRRFGDDLLMLEQIIAVRSTARVTAALQVARLAVDADNGTSERIVADARKNPRQSDLIAYRLSNVPAETRDVWEAVVASLQSLGDDVQLSELKFYWAFKRLRNFCCLEAYPTTRKVLAHLRIDPSAVALEPGFTRDMREVNHFGTGDLQVTLSTLDDVGKALPLFQRAYDGG